MIGVFIEAEGIADVTYIDKALNLIASFLGQDCDLMKAYANWSLSKLTDLKNYCIKNNIELHHTISPNSRKNSSDIELCLDVYDLMHDFDTIVLVSYNSDFTHIAKRILSLNKQCINVCVQECKFEELYTKVLYINDLDKIATWDEYVNYIKNFNTISNDLLNNINTLNHDVLSIVKENKDNKVHIETLNDFVLSHSKEHHNIDLDVDNIEKEVELLNNDLTDTESKINKHLSKINNFSSSFLQKIKELSSIEEVNTELDLDVDKYKALETSLNLDTQNEFRYETSFKTYLKERALSFKDDEIDALKLFVPILDSYNEKYAYPLFIRFDLVKRYYEINLKSSINLGSFSSFDNLWDYIGSFIDIFKTKDLIAQYKDVDKCVFIYTLILCLASLGGRGGAYITGLFDENYYLIVPKDQLCNTLPDIVNIDNLDDLEYFCCDLKSLNEICNHSFSMITQDNAGDEFEEVITRKLGDLIEINLNALSDSVYALDEIDDYKYLKYKNVFESEKLNTFIVKNNEELFYSINLFKQKYINEIEEANKTTTEQNRNNIKAQKTTTEDETYASRYEGIRLIAESQVNREVYKKANRILFEKLRSINRNQNTIKVKTLYTHIKNNYKDFFNKHYKKNKSALDFITSLGLYVSKEDNQIVVSVEEDYKSYLINKSRVNFKKSDLELTLDGFIDYLHEKYAVLFDFYHIKEENIKL